MKSIDGDRGSRSGPTQRRAAGFTLVEMLVVVAILGILMMIGHQTMTWLFPETALSTAARTLATTVEDARNEAVLQGRPLFIEYSLGDNATDSQSYRSIFEPGPGEKHDFDEIEFDLTVSNWNYVPQYVRIVSILVGEEDVIDSGFYSFRVNADGTVASHVVQFYSSELDAYSSVQIASLLDDVHIHQGLVEPIYLLDDDF